MSGGKSRFYSPAEHFHLRRTISTKRQVQHNFSDPNPWSYV